MEQQSCVYCGRMLDLTALIAKDGKYRCKDENECLDYQTRDFASGSLEEPDYASLVDACLQEATERLARYGGTKGEGVAEAAAYGGEAFAWMKSALDGLAAKYAGNQKFTFTYDEATKNRYRIVFNDARTGHFTADLANPAGVRYWLYVTRGEVPAGRTEDAFLYKSYPDDRREEAFGDLVTILLALESEPDTVDTLLNEIRKDLESRCDHP